VGNIHRLSTATRYTPNDGSIGLAGSIAIPARSERSRWWVELLVIVWLCWVYDAITNLPPLRRAAALGHARGVMSLERTLHIDPELTLNRWLSGHHTLGLILSDYYDNAHFVVTLGLLGWLWLKRADIYRPLRNSLVLINVIGFVVFWRYPVAPPRMLVGAGFSDVVASTHAFGSWHTGSLASEANQLAAMPSLHIAWAVWCTLALWRLSKRPWLRLLAVVYPVLTTLVVLATGNHFLLDALAGLLTTIVAVLVVKAGANISGEQPRRNWRARSGTQRKPSRSTPVAESPRLSPSDATQG
jgi:hypothetical protein